MRTYKPHARVARATSQRIDEVDGVPTTHTRRGWHHAWTVTDSPAAAAALPFAAKRPIPAKAAVPAMCALVLIAMVGSLVAVLDGHPNTTLTLLACFGLLAVWTLLLMVPALVRSLR